MKYAIMIYNNAEEEQIFLGIKETVELKSAIKKGIEEYIEEDPDIVDYIGDIDLYIMAEDFNGNIKVIDKVYTLKDFFNSNKKACYFSLNDICSFSKITVEL